MSYRQQYYRNSRESTTSTNKMNDGIDGDDDTTRTDRTNRRLSYSQADSYYSYDKTRQQQQRKTERDSKTTTCDTESVVIPPRNTHHQYGSDDDDNGRYDDNEEQYIRVIAPARLHEGYQFDVMVGGQPFTVEVPRGGVKEGQEFEVLYQPSKGNSARHDTGNHNGDDDDDDYGANEEYSEIGHGGRRSSVSRRYNHTDDDTSTGGEEERRHDDDSEEEEAEEWDEITAPIQTMSDDRDDDSPSQAPTRRRGGTPRVSNGTRGTGFDESTGAPIGKWRTSLLGCCGVVTQSTFWMSFCCTPVLVAQLVSRLQLTWTGQRGGTPEEVSLSYNRIVVGMIIALALWKIPLLGGLILLVYYMSIVCIVGSNVRAHMRHRYQIPTTMPPYLCGGSSTLQQSCDDGCCMIWCSCCSMIQMARHTHDDKEYPGHGCTTTGLGLDAPIIKRQDIV